MMSALVPFTAGAVKRLGTPLATRTTSARSSAAIMRCWLLGEGGVGKAPHCTVQKRRQDHNARSIEV